MAMLRTTCPHCGTATSIPTRAAFTASRTTRAQLGSARRLWWICLTCRDVVAAPAGRLDVARIVSGSSLRAALGSSFGTSGQPAFVYGMPPYVVVFPWPWLP
jgi:hypothetical protein